MIDIALLVLRVVFGGLLLAHGAQKLFGWFGGPGLSGFSGFMGSLGLKPARLWGLAGALAEFGGGLLVVLGLFTPLAALALIAAMVMAILLAHQGKGLWNSNGGSELPLANITVALALIFAGPGAISLDSLLGIELSGLVVSVAAVVVALAIGLAQLSRRQSDAPATRATEA